jgi:hypothetical protein
MIILEKQLQNCRELMEETVAELRKRYTAVKNWYMDDTSPNVSSPYDTSRYVFSRRFYIPVCFIPERITTNRTPPTMDWLSI